MSRDQVLVHNEAWRTDPHGSEEMATPAHQAVADTACVSPSPAGLGGGGSVVDCLTRYRGMQVRASPRCVLEKDAIVDWDEKIKSNKIPISCRSN